MVKVKIYKKNGNIKAIEVKDHANFADRGQDIVCAAVSFLTFNTIDTFTDLLHMENQISYDISEAYIKLEINDVLEDDQLKTSQLILDKFELGMKSLQESYENFIRVDYMEV